MLMKYFFLKKNHIVKKAYDDSDDIRPLCAKLHQMIGHAKYFESNNKTMSFKVIDKKLLKSTAKYGKKLAV